VKERQWRRKKFEKTHWPKLRLQVYQGSRSCTRSRTTFKSSTSNTYQAPGNRKIYIIPGRVQTRLGERRPFSFSLSSSGGYWSWVRLARRVKVATGVGTTAQRDSESAWPAFAFAFAICLSHVIIFVPSSCQARLRSRQTTNFLLTGRTPPNIKLLLNSIPRGFLLLNWYLKRRGGGGDRHHSSLNVFFSMEYRT